MPPESFGFGTPRTELRCSSVTGKPYVFLRRMFVVFFLLLFFSLKIEKVSNLRYDIIWIQSLALKTAWLGKNTNSTSLRENDLCNGWRRSVYTIHFCSSYIEREGENNLNRNLTCPTSKKTGKSSVEFEWFHPLGFFFSELGTFWRKVSILIFALKILVRSVCSMLVDCSNLLSYFILS